MESESWSKLRDLADELLEAARSDPDNIMDALLQARAKTAVNRFYYTSFWCARALLAAIDSKWADSVSHSAMPDLFRKTVRERFVKLIRRQQKNNTIKYARASSLQQQVNESCNVLANTLEEGRDLRVVADYHRERFVQVDASGVNLVLENHKLSEIASWPAVAATHASRLYAILRDLGGSV